MKYNKKKTLQEKIKLKEQKPKRIEYDHYHGRSRTKIFVFDCFGMCGKEIRVQSGRINIHKGRCVSCSQRGRPFEAAYNELYNRKKRHKREVILTYEDFLTFVNHKCHYCFSKILWEPYTRKSGNIVKSGRSYKLDRKNNNLGYLK